MAGRYLMGMVLVLLAGVGVSARADDIQKLELKNQGHTWTYYLHTPAQLQDHPAPLVVIFHGAGGNGRDYLTKNGWVARSDQAGFVVAAPDGLPALPRMPANFRLNPRLWNSGQLGPQSPRAKIDDVAFTVALLDDIARHAPINPRRVFATGHSNGAGMTYRVGGMLSERFAAVATVMGLNTTPEAHPVHGLPTLTLLGTLDPLNPLQGGTRALPWGRSTVPPPSEGIAAWAHSLGCTQAAVTEQDTPDLRIDKFGNCRDGATFTIWFLKGQGHAWPGGQESGLPESVMGPNTTKVNATDVIWQFFASQP